MGAASVPLAQSLEYTLVDTHVSGMVSESGKPVDIMSDALDKNGGGIKIQQNSRFLIPAIALT